MTATTQAQLVGPLLKAVSRSFYLTLRVLSAPIRPQISLAYLLARATDTIADTNAVPRAKRIVLLRELQNLTRVPDLGVLAENQALPAERVLLERLDECLAMLDTFTEVDRRLVQQLLNTIITGQIFDLETFPGNLVALADDAALDRYTYLVAGCVGEFWTKMCQAHLPGLEQLNVADGVRFGQGLQLVNILRDMPRDYAIGRCYLPVRNPLDRAEVLPIYAKWLDVAVAHLDAGWQYTLTIPASQKRLRLACVWPLWIGVKTIGRLRTADPLDATQRVKVSRAEVYGIMARSILQAGNAVALDKTYRQLRQAAG
ncbi:MAG: squalene/phytoene synthase family protein [Verrucomicrobiota bacterium]|jgi:farnesyl-diphosphate farnesyltransferase